MNHPTLERNDKPAPGPIDIVAHTLTGTEKRARFDRYILPETDFVNRISRRMSTNKADAGRSCPRGHGQCVSCHCPLRWPLPTGLALSNCVERGGVHGRVAKGPS